jgi:CubicO group peptidase (beta-lactamase class C family)
MACSSDEKAPASTSPTVAASQPPASAAAAGWQTGTPESQGIDSVRLAQALREIRDRGLNVHSAMIVRNDVVVLDAYFYPYDGETAHQLTSVTKSVMTTLIGIAAGQGKLDLDQTLVSFFPDREIANRDGLKDRITVRHLASMTSGLDCTSDNDEQTLMEMTRSWNWVQFALDLKVVHEPGTHFDYCSPGMHLLSAILEQATGVTALEFARTNLFAPLGIENVIWDADPQGHTHGWAGLFLHPRDAAKLGSVWLHQGQWQGRDIVPAQWVEQSVKRQITTGRGDDYGYGWWVMPGDQGEFSAVGRGGQYIRVFPAMNAIVMLTGGGVEWDEVGPLAASAFVDPVNPLPSDPAGVDSLNAAVAAVAEPPEPKAVEALSEMARAISGKTFVLDPNPLDLETLRLDFDGSAEAHLEATFGSSAWDTAQLPPGTVGLDGIFRIRPVGDHDLPLGLRGSWIDEQTFLLEYDQIANLDAYNILLKFDGDRLTLVAKERSHSASIQVEGRLQDS